MEHVRVGLQFGEPRDLHGSGSRRAAQIIAFEVGDHEQLIMVLAGLLKGGAVGRVLLHGETTWPRSFDGAGDDMAAAAFEEPFRRRADDLPSAAVDIRGERRGIVVVQTQEHVQGRHGTGDVETQRVVHYVGFAVVHVRFESFHGLAV